MHINILFVHVSIYFELFIYPDRVYCLFHLSKMTSELKNNYIIVAALKVLMQESLTSEFLTRSDTKYVCALTETS